MSDIYNVSELLDGNFHTYCVENTFKNHTIIV
jgi:hypothetical protein